MTSRWGKLLWIGYALVLVLLFLMSSTDLIIKEKEPEIYPISVIIDDTTDDFYVNFKKGVDQAARDTHVDVSFITMYEHGQSDQQIERVTREIQDGTRAVILAPADEKAVTKALDENVIKGPVVIVNSELSHNKIAANISEDYYESGRTLAMHVAEKTQADMPVYILTEGLKGSARTRAYDGVMLVLEQNGYETRLVEIESEEAYHSMMADMATKEQKAVLLALDMKSLTDIARLLDDSTDYHNDVEGVYGLGCNLSVLNFLDDGMIDGIVVTNEFIQGYLSIQKAVENIRSLSVPETIKTEHFYIEREDIRNKEFQKLLYPID